MLDRCGDDLRMPPKLGDIKAATLKIGTTFICVSFPSYDVGALLLDTVKTQFAFQNFLYIKTPTSDGI